MDVSPTDGGYINVSGQPPISDYPKSYTCSNSYTLTAAPNSGANYKFDRWGGSASGTSNTITVKADAVKNVTAYFVKKTSPLSLQAAKSLVDGSKDVLVIDVSSASNFAASHMLCAKNYVWNNGSNSFSTSITNLTPYKEDDILIYEQSATNTAAAAYYLANQGFDSISYMTDGLDDWIAEGYETFTTAEDAANCSSLPPMAYAGADQSVNENQKVTLNGSGPSSGVSYAWTQVEGSSVSLSNPTAQKPTFTSPDLNGGDGELIFHLTVTDGSGKKDTDSVTVDVNWNNAAPNANAGSDQTVGTAGTLNGSGSSDPENSIVSYEWSVISGTTNPTLSNSSTVSPSFTAPNKSGWFICQLTVTDNGGLTDTDTVRITVQEGANNPPTANAGSDQSVSEGAAVTLDSSKSTDSDGTIASRQWTQTGGTPMVTLSNSAAIKPVFTAPDVSASTLLTFTLTVTDNDGAIDTDTVTVTVNDDSTPPPPQNVVPTADAGPDQLVTEGDIVTLDGSGSSDSDGTISGYLWTQTDSSGVTVTLSEITAMKPTFTAPDVDTATEVSFDLEITDDDGAKQNDAVTISIGEGDKDGDGFSENQGDCDETDASINPDADDICGDGVDNNCDGRELYCNKLYYSHVASNGRWETEICAVNTGSEDITGVFLAYDNDGNPVSEAIEVRLSAHARKEITVGDELSDPSGIGYIIFESDSEEVIGYTKFYIDSLYRVAIPAIAKVTTGDLYISHIASNNMWWTGISLVNTMSILKNLTIEFSDGSTKNIAIAGHEHRTFSIKSLFGNTPQADIGSAVIKNADGIIGLELFGSANQLSGILLKNDTATDMYYPHITSKNKWWTGIVVYNPSASPCTLTINPYTAAGEALTPMTIDLDGYEKYVGNMSQLGLPVESEWFHVEATQPVTGFELFGTSDNKLLAGYTVVNINRTEGIFAKVDHEGWTGIAFVNIENSEVTVDLTAYNDSGSVVDTESISLDAYEKFVDNPENIFDKSITGATYIAYSSDQEMVGFQLNGSSDGMMLDGLPGL